MKETTLEERRAERQQAKARKEVREEAKRRAEVQRAVEALPPPIRKLFVAVRAHIDDCWASMPPHRRRYDQAKLDTQVTVTEHVIALELAALNGVFKRTFEGIVPPDLPAIRQPPTVQDSTVAMRNRDHA